MSLTRNWDLIGHNRVLSSLEKDMDGGNLSHAYLFTGPDDIGKFAAAKRMALILQCKNNYCGECDACREIEKGYHADTIEICNDGESIKIDKIREIIDKLNMTKTADYKVLLMQNIERMGPEASNALLKTLEDPPENVIFILTASRVKELLPTIISRVRTAKFGRLSDEELKKFVGEHFPEADAASVDAICTFAQGRPGKAMALLEDPELFDAYGQMHADVESLLQNNDRAHQFVYVGQLVTDSKEEENKGLVLDFLDVFQLVVRKQMLFAINGKKAFFPLEKCVRLLQNIQETRQLFKRNVNTRLLLENLMLNV